MGAQEKAQPQVSNRPWRAAITLATIAGAAAAGLWALMQLSPALTPAGEEQCRDLSFATFAQGVLPKWAGGAGDAAGAARATWACAEAYKSAAPVFTLAVFCYAYVALQSLAIPGPLILSIVAGALYGPWYAQLVVCLCATLGATLCYSLSSRLAEPLLRHLAPARLSQLQEQVAKQRAQLLYFMLFLRITPVCPNWAVNLAAPVAGVPLGPFVLGTALGLLPANFFHCSTGSTLASLRADAPLSDNWRSFATLFALQFLALLPALVMRGKGTVATAPAASAASIVAGDVPVKGAGGKLSDNAPHGEERKLR